MVLLKSNYCTIPPGPLGYHGSLLVWVGLGYPEIGRELGNLTGKHDYSCWLAPLDPWVVMLASMGSTIDGHQDPEEMGGKRRRRMTFLPFSVPWVTPKGGSGLRYAFSPLSFQMLNNPSSFKPALSSSAAWISFNPQTLKFALGKSQLHSHIEYLNSAGRMLGYS